MVYEITNLPPETNGENLIATATDGVVYTENNRLHIKSNVAHYVYKYDGNPVGWYRRNTKTLDDIYLGEGACPSIVLETLNVKDEEVWDAIIQHPETTQTEAER